MVLFADLLSGSTWPFGGASWPAVEPAKWYDISRSAIAMVGLVGLGGGAIIAYRRQRVTEYRQDLEQQRHDFEVNKYSDSGSADLHARFESAAEQLGHEKAAVRLAGVYSMVAVSEGWLARGDKRQQRVCVDVLCAYLRMPYDPDTASQGEKEVRLTLLSILRQKLLSEEDPATWCRIPLDFTGATFDGGSLSGARFFSTVKFDSAKFAGNGLSFDAATFLAGQVSFARARFIEGTVSFSKAKFSGGFVDFGSAALRGGVVSFHGAELKSERLSFMRTSIDGGGIEFTQMQFLGGRAEFRLLHDRGFVTFDEATFAGGEVDFDSSKFQGGSIRFRDSAFNGTSVDLSKVIIREGSQFDFERPSSWNVPPIVPWGDGPVSLRSDVYPEVWPPVVGSFSPSQS
ncbi:pentapeptide repeat-containing protein [Pseudarthrobacter quantipunctorum]|uniref:Pentapeptide repeat-containing protein n=1 Tax=Pseudarthrobacter quantipunctorum TaxID=3128980 RepID=A0ABZ2R9N1_9MICC